MENKTSLRMTFILLLNWKPYTKQIVIFQYLSYKRGAWNIIDNATVSQKGSPSHNSPTIPFTDYKVHLFFFYVKLNFYLTDNMKNYVRQNAVIPFKTYSEFSLLDFRTEVRVVNRTEVGEMLGRER